MPATPLLLLLLTFLGFISLGLPDAVTGVVWPSAHRHFGVPLGHLGLLLAAATAGYMASSMLVGRLLQWLGVGGLLAASTALVALSLAGFALAPTWWGFVSFGVLLGLGSGAIDAGLNAYAARHFSARHMTWLHACWGVGATLGAATAALIGGLTFVLAPWTWLSAVGLALLGFSLAPVYPGLMSQTPRRLGRHADHAVGFLVSAAMLGSVLVPSASGLLLQSLGPAWLNGVVAVLVAALWLGIFVLLRPRAS